MITFLIGLIGVVIGFIQTPALLKQRQVKELWVFWGLLLMATLISMAKSIRVPIPTPLEWIMAIYQPLGELINRMG